MALWGKTDALISAPKYIAPTRAIDMSSAAEVAANVITDPGHGFITGDPVTYTSTSAATNLASGTVYYVIRLTADTFSLATSPANAAVPTPIVLTNDGDSGDTFQLTPDNLYFVDFEESQQPENQARGLVGPGWWLYESYTDGNGATRHKAEQLVPMVELAADAGDRNDDLVLVDRTITIDSQPAAASVTSPDPASFVVAASVDPATTITFQWQVSTDGGSNWANSTAAAGTTSSTLDVVSTDADYVDANQFRVVVSSDGATDVTSDAVLLSVA